MYVTFLFCSFVRLSETLKDMLESAYNGSVKHDLAWWSENYGSEMPRNWPRFEVSAFTRLWCKIVLYLKYFNAG